MSNSVYALNVVLTKEIREDDCKPIIDAILMIKGVEIVTTQVADIHFYAAREQAKRELKEKLWNVLY